MSVKRDAWAAVFGGEVDGRVLGVVRTLVALCALVRTSDVLRPIVDLDHHAWVQGLEFAPWSDVVMEPRLAVPMVPGLEVLLAAPIAGALVVVRTASALAMLVGALPRLSAFVLGTSGYLLMAADRFRYLHHMHLLYTTCLLLALAPQGGWTLRRALESVPVPRWPVSLLRFHVLVIYLASGLAKLEPRWLDGTTINRLVDARLMDAALVDALGAVPIAWLVLLVELGLVLLLAWPKTRAFGVVVGLLFHAATALFMMVSIFPVLMGALLLLFIDVPLARAGTSSGERIGASSAA